MPPAPLAGAPLRPAAALALPAPLGFAAPVQRAHVPQRVTHASQAAGAHTPGPEPYLTHDVQLGQIFTNMRVAMKVSRDTIARRLATTVFVIEMLESGTVASFPHWRETARIVRGYCELLRLDPEPILWRIRSHYHASGLPMGLMTQDAPMPYDPGAQNAAPTGLAGKSRPVSGARPAPRSAEPAARGPRRRGRLFVLTAPVVLAAGLLIGAQNAPEPIYAAIHLLPQRFEAPAQQAFNGLVHVMAPTREGLRWIDVDPQFRKGDKLQTNRR